MASRFRPSDTTSLIYRNDNNEHYIAAVLAPSHVVSQGLLVIAFLRRHHRLRVPVTNSQARSLALVGTRFLCDMVCIDGILMGCVSRDCLEGELCHPTQRWCLACAVLVCVAL